MGQEKEMIVKEEKLFTDTCLALFEACGEMDSWTSGLCDRLAKNLVSMAAQPDIFVDFDQTRFDMVIENYARRKTLLQISGKLPIE